MAEAPAAWPVLVDRLVALAQWHDPTADVATVDAFLDNAAARADARLSHGGGHMQPRNTVVGVTTAPAPRPTGLTYAVAALCGAWPRRLRRDPARSSGGPEAWVPVLNQVLLGGADRGGIALNRGTGEDRTAYYDPRNSFLPSVVRRRLGAANALPYARVTSPEAARAR